MIDWPLIGTVFGIAALFYTFGWLSAAFSVRLGNHAADALWRRLRARWHAWRLRSHDGRVIRRAMKNSGPFTEEEFAAYLRNLERVYPE